MANKAESMTSESNRSNLSSLEEDHIESPRSPLFTISHGLWAFFILALFSQPVFCAGPAHAEDSFSKGLRYFAEGKMDSAILALMYFAGLRASDVVSLTLEQIDTERSVIHSPWSRAGLISIPHSIEAIRNYLLHGRPHLARDPEEHSLFLNQKGTGLTRQGLWLIVKKWVEVANIDAKVTPHTLRHSLAKHLLDSGASLKEVQQKLGLKSPNSIRIFIQPGEIQSGLG